MTGPTQRHGAGRALPPLALRFIAQVLGASGERKPVTLVPSNHELSTIEAAHFLNVSRPFVIKEIEANRLPHHKVGSHCRISYEDLVAYRANVRAKQKKALQNLADNDQESNLENQMAGAARYTALLDACALFPPRMADALMSLHEAGLYTARWAARIDQEWIGAVLRRQSNPVVS